MRGNTIKDLVGKYYRVNMELSSRKPVAVRPRQVAMYLCRQYTKLSYNQIANIFGGMDHSTVMNNCQKIAELMAEDSVLVRQIEELNNQLEGIK